MQSFSLRHQKTDRELFDFLKEHAHLPSIDECMAWSDHIEDEIDRIHQDKARNAKIVIENESSTRYYNSRLAYFRG